MTATRQQLQKKTLDVIEWPALTAQLASRTASSLGAEAAASVSLATTIEAVKRSLAETAELVDLLRGGDNAPFMAFSDIRPTVDLCRRHGIPDPKNMTEVASSIEATRLLRGYLKNARDACPLLWERAAALNELADLRRSIEDAIDPAGQLKENASPELKRLLRSARDKRAHLISRLEEFLRDQDIAPMIMDEYYTQRVGRYVAPVKAEYRSKIEGIVHDSSNSGQTLFIEPKAFIGLNNELKMTDMAIEAEARRILKELADKTAAAADALISNIMILVELDLVYAKARLSLDLNGISPSVNTKGRIELFAARHPLLALEGNVVPNDIAFDENVNALIISGPNTGGKTVTLKTVGLFALMIRAGLLIPASPNSTFALFRDVYADIGDEQDIERHLSTFSGHMLNIVGILNAVSPGALVLLDELVTSTDPGEGSALAAAILSALTDKGAKVVATTHYSQLKAYAESKRGFRNASVEFDAKSLSPTYRLVMGIPGRSSALDIAGGLGVDKKILADARALLSESDKKIEDMLAALEFQRQGLVDETREAESLKNTARRQVEENERISAELREKTREFRLSVRTRLATEIRSAREKIDKVMDALNKDKSRIVVMNARGKLRELEKEISRESVARGSPIDPTKLKEGDAVMLSHLGATGVLMEDPSKNGKLKKKVAVKVGRATMKVAIDSLSAPDGGGIDLSLPEDIAPRKRKSEIAESAEAAAPAATLDLRGFRVEDALDETRKFLDRAALLDLKEVEIIHGHGTGALKKSIRELLDGSGYVADWRPADLKMGGDGVSIVRLK